MLLGVALMMACDDGPSVDETHCRGMAYDVCERRIFCFGPDAPSSFEACRASVAATCAGKPAAASDACAAAVHDQDCAELHAHVMPAACKF